MNFLLFSGPPNSGKTSSIRMFHDYLIQQLLYIVYHSKQINSEVKCVLENSTKTRKILIWSETDQVGSINALKDYINVHSDVDTVIIASRAEGDRMRGHLWLTLNISNQANYNFEIPLGRMKRGISRPNIVNWYLQCVQNVAKIIGSQPPFSF